MAARRVLIVDDNQDAAETLQEFVALLGHEVRVAHDGQTALELARGWAPAVALLDISLPGMSGYEVARELRRLSQAPLRLVALSGYGQESDRERSLEAGFDLHLVKPVELQRLEAVLAQ